MLISFLHNPSSEAVSKAHDLSKELVKKNPEALHFSLRVNDFLQADIDELTLSKTMFKSKYIVMLIGVLQQKDSADKFLDNIERFAGSEHLFLLADEPKDTKIVKILEKHSEKISISKKIDAKRDSDNLFYLSDTLISGDTKKLFLQYNQALSKASVENIYGILAWSMKTLILSSTLKAGQNVLKSFVFQKNTNALRKLDLNKTKHAYSELVSLPVKSRKTNVALELLLEQWISSLNIKNTDV